MQFKTSFRLFTLSTILLFVGFTSTYAQQRWSAGPRLGVNFSSLVGTGNDKQYIPGAVIGGFIMYSDIRHFGASADVLFSQKGAKQRGPNDFINRLNYIEIPIAFRYFLTTSGDFRPNLFVGPSVGFLTNAQVRNNGSSPTQDNSMDFKSTDIGLLAGFQLNWKAGSRQRFLIDGRYTYGLPDIYVGANSNNIETHNSAFTLTVGYSFGIGRNF